MKLLLDANLSWRMCKVLHQHFEACYHVDGIEELSKRAKDKDIWNFARKNNLIIVTNDDDFIDYSNSNGFPPKVILIKTGNQSRVYLCNLLIQRRG